MRQSLLLIAVIVCSALPLAAQCPTAFSLSGSAIDNTWKKTTPSAWSKMLPKGWVDKGNHFYERARDRGPKQGINTPSDLETEIRKAVKDVKDTSKDAPKYRRDLILPLQNSKGKALMVVYDYDKTNKTAKCELVTLTFEGENYNAAKASR